MRVNISVKSIQGSIVVAGAVECEDSIADSLKALASDQSHSDVLDRCTLYYHGRKISRKSTVTDAFPDCCDIVLLAIPRKSGSGRSKHSGKVSKPVPEKPAACPAAVEAVPDAHNSDLVYGLAHGDQDTLLPGFVSRPHPSPTNRLVQAKQTASPVIASALQLQSTSRCQSKQLRSSKRRLVFHQEAKHDEATQAEPVGGTAPCSSPTAADAERWPDAYEETNDGPEAPKQSATDQQSRVASPVQPTFMAAETPRLALEGHVTEAQQKKPKRGAQLQARATKAEPSWGCSLFAPRITKAAEDAMHHMPLPVELAVFDRLFAALSALCLWLKKTGVQASWLTVRDALRDVFQAEGLRVTAEHVLRLAQLCPLLVEVGQDRPWHASWAAKRRGAAPDAAEVAVRARATRDHAPRAPDTGGDDSPPGSPAGTAGAANEEKPSLQQLELAAAGLESAGVFEGATKCCSGSFHRGVAGDLAGSAAAGCGSPSKDRQEGDSVIVDLTDANGSTEAVRAGTDFVIRLQDAPRHVPCPGGAAPHGNRKSGRKKKGKDGLEVQHAAALDDVQAAAEAAVAAAESQPRPPAAAVPQVQEAGLRGVSKEQGMRNKERDGMDGMPAEPTGQRAASDMSLACDAEAACSAPDGDPAFVPGSFYARHFNTFRRCIVQAVALLHEAAVAPIEGVSLADRMADILQALLPAPAVELPVKPATVKKHCPAPQDEKQGSFGQALRSGEWAATFSVADIRLDSIRAAAAALMTHWSVMPDDDNEGSVAALCHIHTQRNKPPCLDTTPLSAAELLDHLKGGHNYEAQVVHVERMPARQARCAELPFELHPPVTAALTRLGIQPSQLFCHQVEAITALLQQRHVAVCTSTASGKSLCYLVPVLQSLAEDPEACALFMFPTKALAQDQRAALQRMLDAAFPTEPPPVDVYDGDTPQEARAAIRSRARLLVTNPDMLHQSMLPVHGQFQRFLANLRYVVVDEGHMYKGAFGCHVSAVLRRLRRICAREFAREPVFAVTSATSSQPEQHVCALLGVQAVHVVSDDGSPHGPRLFALWNPPLTVGKAGGAPLPAGAAKPPPRPGFLSHTESRVRSLELRRAKQEAARQAQRARNAARTGSKLLGQGVTDEQWRQQLAIGRKRHRASGEDEATGSRGATGGHNASEEGSAAPATAAEASAEPPPVVPATHAAAPSQTDEPAKEAACEGQGGCQGGQQGSSDVPAGGEVELRPPHRCGGAGGMSAGAAGAVSAEQPRRGAARRREVQGLLDSVGGSRSRTGGSSTIIIGDRRSCESLPQNVRDEIREHLNEAAKADKAKRTEGRYGAAGVALEQRRRSPILEISLLLAECMQHGLRTIAFCKTRKVCELVTSYTRDVLRETAPMLASRLAVYRSGYSAAERRAIEAALHSGDLCGVAATNALELGIDIGGLDVTLHLSFPGTVASLWQQAGRAGRREQTSLSVYVAFDGPLDQHFMRNPHKLFSRTIETPQVNPSNAVLLQQHLVCASVELPLVPRLDQHFFGQAIHPCVAALCGTLKLVPTPGQPGAFHYIGGHMRPAASVSLRTIDPDHFSIINEANGETLEQIEACNAFFEVYDGAVYLFHGRPYLCKRLDLTTRVAHVVAADVRYYTKPVHNRDVHVTGSRLAYAAAERPQFGRTSARVGPAVVTERFMAFVRIWRGSGIAFDRVDLFLPDVQFMTEAAYIRVPSCAQAQCDEAGVAYREGLHAAGHAMVNVLPLFMSCNPADMRAECDNPYATRFRPERLLMYDSHPGGLGLAAEAGPMFTAMLQEALQLITRCDCTEPTGCPSCIHFSCCDAYNATLSKHAAVIVLSATLQQEMDTEERSTPGAAS